MLKGQNLRFSSKLVNVVIQTTHVSRTTHVIESRQQV